MWSCQLWRLTIAILQTSWGHLAGDGCLSAPCRHLLVDVFLFGAFVTKNRQCLAKKFSPYACRFSFFKIDSVIMHSVSLLALSAVIRVSVILKCPALPHNHF